MAVEFRTFLKDELDRRTAKNPKYSLRSFARFIGISHTSLSCILRGQRPISSKTKTKVAMALGIDPEMVDQFDDHPLVDGSSPNFERIGVDSYHLIADWHHDAILELVATRGFKDDPGWIASKLGIKRTEARVAVERLQKMGLIEKDHFGRSVVAKNTTNTHQPLGSTARRKNQMQILDLSKESIEKVSLEVRDHSSITMAIDTRDLPVAKEMIKDFRRQLMARLQAPSKNFNQVYQLHIGFFPLSERLD
ncbi:TIGR02147 family protein [bacterium]|nr:TIGR02147 family protein [bacterium]